MTDQEKWDTAVAAVSAEYARLTDGARERLRHLLAKIKRLKEDVHSYAGCVAGTAICASCGGECCVVGKYHFTVIDLLVYLSDGMPLFQPRFRADACPFLGDSGCMMAPSCRPYNCVTFNCDRIHYLLSPADQERFTDAERKLRSAYRELEELADNRFMHGLLINCERDLLPGTRPILGIEGAEGARRTGNG